MNHERFYSLVQDWRAKANEITDAGDVGPIAQVVVEQLHIRADDLEHAVRGSTTEDPGPRYIFPDENDPSALRVELSLQGVSARGVAIIATDNPQFADKRNQEPPVRVVVTLAQATDLVRRLQAVLAEI